MVGITMPTESGKIPSPSHDLETDDSAADEETKLIGKQKECKVASDVPQKYPRSVFFIIGNEFCERFSYYGMRAVLTIYLIKVLGYGDDPATMIYHSFTMLCYFTPLFGAMLADSWLGKYRTIFYISIIYAIGNVTISVGSVPQSLVAMNTISLIGLGLIAVGTGGIKPCVSAFGGDQFEKGQELYLAQFFSLFYMSINLGSVLSTFITPLLRESVTCFGSKSCFPLAFGVPAILMIVSLILFLLGKPKYKIVPPSGNIVLKVSKCICHALVQKSKTKEKKKDHWLSYADDTYDPKFIEDIKGVLHVLLLYVPLPIFWALFDQQGSRWTLQATRMNGEFYGYNIKPDQVQVINPFLIIAFIPLFEYVVYPLLKKCNILQKPLQRITVGGLLAALAFVIAGFLELELEKTYPVLPQPHHSEITLINNSPCKILISGGIERDLDPFQEAFVADIPLGESQNWKFSSSLCADVKTQTPVEFQFESLDPIQSMMITIKDGGIKIIQMEDSKAKPEKGESKIRIFFNINYKFEFNETAFFKLVGPEASYSLHSNMSEESKFGMTEYEQILPGKYMVHIPINETMPSHDPVGDIVVQSGGSYILSIFQDQTDFKVANLKLFTIVNPNSIHMLYQAPQYIIMTAGEIMFSITGLEFSYSQAPTSMKSVLQAAWLLTVAFGNLIVVIVAEAKFFEQQSLEFFMFATLMGLDMLIFSIMAFFYKYVNVSIADETETPSGITDTEYKNIEKGKSNMGYEEDTKF